MTTNTTESTEYNDALLVGLTVDDLRDDPFYQVSVSYGVGRNRQDKNWGNLTRTRGQLVADLSTFEYGEKDGKCITQGPLVAGQRIAKNMQAAHFIMLDCDTGEDMDSLERKVRDKGWAAVLWHTYSHMKPTTEIPEDRLVKFAREMRTPLTNDGVALAALAADYLASKRYTKELTNSITSVSKQHVDGGVKYVVRHAPMSRARVLIWLKRPYVFATEAGTHAAGIQRWKELYAGVAEMLNVDHDQSCVDPSRLMYLPRVPADAVDRTPYERGFDIRVIHGKALDLDAVTRIKSDKRYTEAHQHPLSAALGAKEDAHTLPKWLLKFAKEHGNDLELVDLIGSAEDALSNTGDKAEFPCPNEDRHTEQKADDRAFCVWNASGREGGFDARCQHATCKEDSHGDRLWWLWKLCEKYGWTEDDLLQFCPNAAAEEAEQAEIETAEADAVAAALADLTARGDAVTSIEIEEFLELVAGVPSAVRRDELVSTVAKACNRNKGPLTTELDAIMRRQRTDAAAQEHTVSMRQPVPNDFTSTSTIWLHWPIPDQKRIVRERFEKVNNTDPVLFRRPDGGPVLVANNTTLSTRIVDAEPLAKVLYGMLGDFNFRFIGTSDDGDPDNVVDRDIPSYAVDTLIGSIHKLDLPQLDKISRTPVFSKEGVLITEKGYNALTYAWYDPGTFQFLDVPETVTDDDLDVAVNLLIEPLRDFPFSDAFEDIDHEPIRSGELDADGFPLPNLKRGRGSRANAIAMILQPFARAMIDGPTPQYHIDKPARGTGAGFLVDVLWAINKGTKFAEITSLPHDNAEIKKVITSLLIEGEPMCFVDNVQQHVESADFAALLTADTWKDRKLGHSQVLTIPVRTQFIMAGNRVGFNEDMMRRNIPIFLNAVTPNPASDRPLEYYKHKNIQEWVQANRAELVWACHVIIKAWVQAGMPEPTDSPVLQSFNSWSRVMGGILEYAGITGFLSNRDAYMKARNEDSINGSNLVTRIWERFGEDVKTSADWLDACGPSGGGAGLSAHAGSGKDFDLDPTLELNFITAGKRNGAYQQLSKHIKNELLQGTFVVDDAGTKVTVTRTEQNHSARWQLKKVE